MREKQLRNNGHGNYRGVILNPLKLCLVTLHVSNGFGLSQFGNMYKVCTALDVRECEALNT